MVRDAPLDPPHAGIYSAAQVVTARKILDQVLNMRAAAQDCEDIDFVARLDQIIVEAQRVIKSAQIQ